MKEVFRNIFIKLLQSRNMSAYKLSFDIHIPQSSISYWKRGLKAPTAENLITLADYFNVSIDYLVGRTDKPEVNK